MLFLKKITFISDNLKMLDIVTIRHLHSRQLSSQASYRQ